MTLKGPTRMLKGRKEKTTATLITGNFPVITLTAAGFKGFFSILTNNDTSSFYLFEPVFSIMFLLLL